MAYGPSLLQQTWDEIDALYNEFATTFKPQHDNGGLPPRERDEMLVLQGRMRGIASVLARYMVPHLTNENDVVREVAKRWRMKKAGEEYETPGLGSRTYEPPPGDHKLARKAAPPTVKLPSHLTPDDIQEIKASSFPVEILASSYDITPPMVKLIQSQA